jgi:hypothetical protein
LKGGGKRIQKGEILKGKKYIYPFQGRWLEWAFSNVHPQVMCGGDIKKLSIITYH